MQALFCAAPHGRCQRKEADDCCTGQLSRICDDGCLQQEPSATQKAKEVAKSLKDRTKETAQQVAEKVVDKTEQAKEKLSHAAEKSKERVSEATEMGKEKLAQAGEKGKEKASYGSQPVKIAIRAPNTPDHKVRLSCCKLCEADIKSPLSNSQTQNQNAIHFLLQTAVALDSKLPQPCMQL